MKMPLPRLASGAEAEAFVASADLTDYDLSGMVPVRFEQWRKDKMLDVIKTEFPEAQLDGARNYDVAISFLAKDEPIAKQLAERLEEGLGVFFFPHSQEELAGTNGLESMRLPFLQARVVVILFRKPWGETPWTRVEETAIFDRSLKSGWSSLLFVQLDRASEFPKWLPNTHVRFSFEDYGIDQLVGAIKVRVQDQGGVITPSDAMSKAKRVQHEAAYLADRSRLMSDQNWIVTTVHSALRETMLEAVRLVDKANAEFGFQIDRSAQDKTCVLRSGWVSMIVTWRQPITNLVGVHGDDRCYLQAQEYSGGIALPGERVFFPHQPRKLKEHRFRVEIAQDRSLVWVEGGKPQHIAPGQLADTIVQRFLDLVSRANKGEIEPPSI